MKLAVIYDSKNGRKNCFPASISFLAAYELVREETEPPRNKTKRNTEKE